MPARTRRQRPPLDEQSLEELALRYVGRFATTRAKLAQYLGRKLRERGWAGTGDPPVDALVAKCAANGFVDDSAFAAAKARSLSGRGYGAGRIRQSLRAAGVDDADAQDARAIASGSAVDAALRFARRKRIGPFAPEAAERQEREKAIAAMVRAGHPYGISRTIAELAPGAEIEPGFLSEATEEHPI